MSPNVLCESPNVLCVSLDVLCVSPDVLWVFPVVFGYLQSIVRYYCTHSNFRGIKLSQISNFRNFHGCFFHRSPFNPTFI